MDRDHVQRMYNEAADRIEDADFLVEHGRDDSDAYLRILGFEILLKCALTVCKQEYRRNHNYHKLWCGLPGYARTEIIGKAQERMANVADYSGLEDVLGWYQFIFEKARYHYELYKGYTSNEVSELSELWIQIGAPTHEAIIQYYPEELIGLIHGLKWFIERALKTDRQ